MSDETKKEPTQMGGRKFDSAGECDGAIVYSTSDLLRRPHLTSKITMTIDLVKRKRRTCAPSLDKPSKLVATRRTGVNIV